MINQSRSTSAAITLRSGAEVMVPVLAFAVPFLVSGPQWLTGTLVNCFLFLSAKKLSSKVLTLVIVLPSIAALAHGALFGVFTPFLAYFLPLIWLGNLLLVQSFKFIDASVSPVLSVLLSSFLKSVLLYIAAVNYLNLGLVPVQFLVSMGLIQFVTAVFGGYLALGMLSLIEP